MDGPNLWIVLALGLVAIGWYLTYTAARLDRLHARVQGTLAALDAQLVRRAEATLELANARVLDAASALMLASAASDSLSAAEDEDTDADRQRFSNERETVESRLSEALGLALTADTLASLPGAGGFGDDIVSRVRATGLRVQLARRFHNDAVTDVRRVRRQWAVKWFRLAGHADMPQTVEFVDALPHGLRG
ncbi:MAG: hypothetical protein IPI13_04275 [Actinomycetales bacterium]|jgi:hypothetical protein|uniref:LemA family protein n=1 Tax=Candidatus Phosphoribacter hodrii TaxID=2953743 RepID=A0A935MGM0_9MICO|nr:hypothetical protein [Candidatus Phosphoribacter hodrii]OPZ54783.1 MAG: hypothetical protein BWY91_01457 [bacterium ADurb.BinA028]HNV14816.1 hypothetical protein [Dermatophilaceae bacterium]MBL0003620.1 hypothetical protein [Candidatus Phosphoribacter hodrii]HOA04098.1 hypothetical protein [Dermatophilaceae bacterium]